jgi:glycosidase
MVSELVSATGTNTPGSERFNGAVNFLTMKVNEEKGTQATADTAKIFMGLQVQCTQCHNHPFNEWKQQKFWEFNSFFRQTRALRRFVPGTREIAGSDLVDQDFPGEGTSPAEAEIYYEQRNGVLKAAYPVFVDEKVEGYAAVGKSGFVGDVNRRSELGQLILASEYTDMMVANRYWAHFFGYGFTKPIDDMGPHNPPSHPELVAYLGQQVREHSYNLKELIRWITLSEAYSASSRVTKANENDDPLLGETPKFTHFYLRQMRAEELYESLLVATKAAETRGSYEDQERSKTQWLSQFVMAFGNDEGGEQTTFNGTIPQALMMFNGELIRNATDIKPGSFLGEIARSNLKQSQQIDYLFKAALSRRPSSDERSIAMKLFIARASDQVGNDRKKRVDPGAANAGALQDIWWAVLNSNEFIMNH